MTIKSILVAVTLVISPQLYASNLFKLTTEPLTINQCSISETDNPLDLALSNNGYFVVSHGKKDSELLFTRYGAMYLDNDSYLRNYDNHYLLAVTKKSDAKHLSKIKIPLKNLAPKATTKIITGFNLPANAARDDSYRSSMVIYDSIAGTHIVGIYFAKIAGNTWSARVFVDDVKRDEGTLVFYADGKFSKQEGLRNVQWPADYGMHVLKIDLQKSTQYNSHYDHTFLHVDGYGLGRITSLYITTDGDIVLLYTNGQRKLLKNRIAVAKFTNPSYLEPVTSHLYRPSEKSGQPMIHWVNGENSVQSGYLEEAVCLKE